MDEQLDEEERNQEYKIKIKKTNLQTQFKSIQLMQKNSNQIKDR